MKSMKDFAAQQLSKKQMNKVNGGASCSGGKWAYSCSLYRNGRNMGSSGYVCGYTAWDAMNAANRELAYTGLHCCRMQAGMTNVFLMR